MEIKQFYDKCLAHASYAILSGKEIALIDPARDPRQYYDFAQSNKAVIKAVIETHPHADFVSSHLEIHLSTGADIFVSKLVNALYKHIPFDEGDELRIGNITLIPYNTPGHSPDSISILIRDEDGKDYALASGDTLFVGDVGRPDLRESAGAINKSKTELARMMYRTINERLLKFSDDVIVYPAHGAGSLCGKATSADTFSTIGRERKENYALQNMSEDEFIGVLLKDQSFVPKYFGYDVELNRRGAPDFLESVSKVKRIDSYLDIKKNSVVIDTRQKREFSSGHFAGAINLMEDSKFETWLGTIVSPEEKFYLISESETKLNEFIKRAAKIGYEFLIEGALVHHDHSELKSSKTLDTEFFKSNKHKFTILDIRDNNEKETIEIFRDSIHIPLNQLKERLGEIPVDKPVVVHCAAGFRSAVGSSLLENLLSAEVFDLSDNVKQFL
ncbi:MAG: Hydroxyacylglutathione hydrolase [Ignavibacteria bacterium]|nr:Hydroxyacylglutathione hydrolase [Ignavibacteria bacterium]